MSRKTICGGCGKIIADTVKCPCKVARQRARSLVKNDSKPEERKLFNSTKWKKFRLDIINRDGASCQRCLIQYNRITTANLEVHHIKPRTKYPELIFEATNCVTLCKTCNLQLGVKEQLDFPFTPNERDDFVL